MSQALIAVLGGINIDILIKTERIPAPGESLSGTSLAKYPGGKGANTAISVYRASHKKPKEGKINAEAFETYQECNSRSEVRTKDSHDKPINVFVYLNGAVGQDDVGAHLLENVAMNGVDVS